MKANIQNWSTYILSVMIFVNITACNNLESLILKQQEIENPKQFKASLISEITTQIKPSDTLFLVTTRLFGVCGNDPTFDNITTPEEAKANLEYIKANPYFVNADNDFEEINKIGTHVVIVGTAFEDEFSSENFTLKNENTKVEKIIYDIDYTAVQKDTVQVALKQFYQNDVPPINLTFVLNQDKWHYVNNN